MDIATGHALQLGFALILGLVFFGMAFAASDRLLLALLVVLIPFQIIMSRYGSLNTVLTYLVGMALLLRGHLRHFPLWPIVGAILLAYLISLSQSLPATWKDHVLYLITIGGSFVLFYIVYNVVSRSGDVGYALRLMLWMNILVLLYTSIQLVVGYSGFTLFGISEFSFAYNLEEKQRLVGPFGAPGVNAEYFALQILVIAYMILHTPRRWKQALLFSMIAANFGFLVATGSRGSFLTLLGGLGLFFWFFRRQLGLMAILRASVIGLAVLVATAGAVIRYSDFNVLFERLGQTELKEGIPDTRVKAFSRTLERVPEAMIVGHGPRLVLMDEVERNIPGYVPLGHYPHNLALFLLYSVGIIGLIAWTAFFLALARRNLAACHWRVDDPYLTDIPKLAILLLIVFLVDQLKIEFLRYRLNDMQHYVFALFGSLLALSDVMVLQAKTQRSKSGSPPVRAIYPQAAQPVRRPVGESG